MTTTAKQPNGVRLTVHGGRVIHRRPIRKDPPPASRQVKPKAPKDERLKLVWPAIIHFEEPSATNAARCERCEHLGRLACKSRPFCKLDTRNAHHSHLPTTCQDGSCPKGRHTKPTPPTPATQETAT